MGSGWFNSGHLTLEKPRIHCFCSPRGWMSRRFRSNAEDLEVCRRALVFSLRWKFKEVCSDTRQRNAIAGTDELANKSEGKQAKGSFFLLHSSELQVGRSQRDPPFYSHLELNPSSYSWERHSWEGSEHHPLKHGCV